MKALSKENKPFNNLSSDQNNNIGNENEGLIKEVPNNYELTSVHVTYK